MDPPDMYGRSVLADLFDLARIMARLWGHGYSQDIRWDYEDRRAVIISKRFQHGGHMALVGVERIEIYEMKEENNDK
jgi:hypothetical protein